MLPPLKQIIEQELMPMKPLDLLTADSHPVTSIVNIPVGFYYVRGLLDGVCRLGLDAEKVLEEAQISVSTLDSSGVSSYRG